MHTRLVHECCVDRVDKGKRPEAFSMSSTSLGLCMSGTHEHEADASFRERSGQRCYQSCELFSTTPVVFPAPSFFQSNVLATQHVGGDLPYRSLQNSPVRVGAQQNGTWQGHDASGAAPRRCQNLLAQTEPKSWSREPLGRWWVTFVDQAFRMPS